MPPSPPRAYVEASTPNANFPAPRPAERGRRLAALLAVSIDRAEERSEGSATHTVFIVRVQGQGHDYELETRYSAIANLRKVSLV